MVEAAIVSSVQTYLSHLRSRGIPIRFGVVFGSRVTGPVREWSDIDLVVVSPIFDGRRSHEQIDELWITASEIDSRIEPIPCGELQWAEDCSSAIIEIARREGEIVPLEEE